MSVEQVDGFYPEYSNRSLACVFYEQELQKH